MANRYDGSAKVQGRDVPLFVVRCVALMVVLLSLIPVCADSAGEAFPSSGGMAAAAAHVPQQGWGGGSVAGHLCPATGHVQCRRGESVAASVPSPQVADRERRVAVDTTWVPLAPTSCQVADPCKWARSIEELQVQRT
ncbi:hypothetical protein ACFWRZ_04995 [Streptomyces rubiginosohelvolus]|uniref:hypothetical protein n=1 Tax=Streptomyces TaxID=1883 RepID=UPI0033308EF3